MYGSLNLTASSPPQSFTEPLAVEELQSYLNLPARIPFDTREYYEIETMISAAREQAEIFQNRDLVRKQYDLSMDYWHYGRYQYCIALRDPLVSVDLFKVRDSDGAYTTLADGTGYIADTAKHPGIVMPPYGGSWPSVTLWPSSAILIRFTSGFLSTDAFWSDAGARVKIGMKLLISAWFTNRLPFEVGANAVQEYPMAVTSCMSYGALPRAR